VRLACLALIVCGTLGAQSDIALVGAGYVNPIPVRVAPGQVVTFFLTGMKTVLPPPFRAERAPSVPLPKSLAGISATIHQSGPNTWLEAPIFSVDQINTCGDTTDASPNCLLTAVTLQVPFELVPRNPLNMSPLDLIGTTEISFTENGETGKSFRLSPVLDSIHVLTNCGDTRMDDYGALPCQSLVTHADGSLVSVWGKVAKPGETLVIYAYGLGATDPAVKTGEASPVAGIAAPVRIDLDFRPNAGPSRLRSSLGYGPAASTQASYVGLVPGAVGLYQINFQVPQPPPGTPRCGSGIDSNLTVTIQGAQSLDAARLCVETQ
jgi:hypothetical protein